MPKEDKPVESPTPTTEILNPDEVKDVKESIQRGVGFAKRWQTMKDLKNFIDEACATDKTMIIFNVKAFRLQAYLTSIMGK